ncbi:sulfite exporter TauE/SafE family protein [uncultured Pseudokineococcus sp.]|uniref:sulfite exporter TauE/SafE family protein n=1 Tax=uncultured Pseudokineococcus sp. TaxID=1642928 RepID=UPI002639C55B|nr:sulfite exporter TauE/SafE family protein [uncultured Pseudokineococcus sp.]
MSPLEFGLLVLAGVGGGLVGSIVGLASLVTYPALLAAGLPPVTANVTNTVALVASGVGSAASSRPELTGQRARLVRLAPVFAVGGLAGAVLLVTTPGEVFERVVPFLVGGASVLMLAQPRLRRLLRREAAPVDPGDDVRESWPALAGLFLVAVYGGYFGAAAGVIVPMLLGFVLDTTIQRLVALKNILLMVSNLVAAALFLVLGEVDLLAALPLAGGILVGGWLGPIVARRLPQGVLRAVIGVAGLGLAVRLWVTAG